MWTITACLLNLVTTAVLFHCTRLVLRVLVPRKDSFGRPWGLMAEEFVSTMDFCSGCCELAFIYDQYGTVTFSIILFLLCLWWCWSFGDAAANPNKYIEDGIRGHLEWAHVGLLVFTELFAAMFVMTYMRHLWAIGWSHEHESKSSEKDCHADLQVSVFKGAIVEGVITFIDRLNALTLEEIDWPHSTLTCAFLSTFLVVSALHSSGGYFNPALATSLKMGCDGHSILEFIMVYWVGSVIGSLIALTFHKTVGVKKLVELAHVKNE
ncbi:hypothetical protein CHUAL_001784 [Chamberlinius hualienensis]